MLFRLSIIIIIVIVLIIIIIIIIIGCLQYDSLNELINIITLSLEKYHNDLSSSSSSTTTSKPTIGIIVTLPSILELSRITIRNVILQSSLNKTHNYVIPSLSDIIIRIIRRLININDNNIKVI